MLTGLDRWLLKFENLIAVYNVHTFSIGTFCICLSEHIFRLCSRQVLLFRRKEKVLYDKNNRLGTLL